jgi:hypothetical protein
VADSLAAKEQVQSLLLEHGDVARKIGLMNQRLEDMGAVAARPATEVFGVAAPVGLLGRLDTTSATRVDALSCCSGGGVAYHFAHDCPIELTTAPTGTDANEAATQAMIAAVVTDLKGAFQFYAESHAKIGVPQVVEVGA